MKYLFVIFLITSCQKNLYFKDGGIKKKQFYMFGKPIGTHFEYYKSGKLMKKIDFRNGLHHGEYIEWYESGQVYIYRNYKDGHLTGHKMWRPNGRIYSNYVYKKGKRLGISGGKLCFTTKDSQNLNGKKEL